MHKVGAKVVPIAYLKSNRQIIEVLAASAKGKYHPPQ